MYISDSVRYVGVNDHRVDLFEGQYCVPNGMSYNSYVITDGESAVLDTVDAAFGGEWLDNIARVLEGKSPDYLIVQHMEPDHSANILRFAETYPQAKIVSSAKAFQMMRQFFGRDFAREGIVVGEGDSLQLGSRSLQFITAPMVHWPEIIMTYDAAQQLLFSADAFGKFGALDAEEDWTEEARRYYIGIVGKYGAQVQAVLKKAAGLQIRTVCPLHGPVLEETLGRCLELYQLWSSYTPEEQGTVIAYCSVYGNTKKAAEYLARGLQQRGVTVALYDLARCDMARAVADAFRYSSLVLASTTYNGDVFPFMRSFVEHLTERLYRKRSVAFVENGSWAPAAAKVMKGMLEGCKELRYAETAVKILSAPDEETFRQLDALADELAGQAG